eukprot:768012-Hanusia_phi.AAC.9
MDNIASLDTSRMVPHRKTTSCFDSTDAPERLDSPEDVMVSMSGDSTNGSIPDSDLDDCKLFTAVPSLCEIRYSIIKAFANLVVDSESYQPGCIGRNKIGHTFANTVQGQHCLNFIPNVMTRPNSQLLCMPETSADDSSFFYNGYLIGALVVDLNYFGHELPTTSLIFHLLCSIIQQPSNQHLAGKAGQSKIIEHLLRNLNMNLIAGANLKEIHKSAMRDEQGAWMLILSRKVVADSAAQ